MNNMDVRMEEHLDFMIHLACQDLESKELETLIAESKQECTLEDEEIINNAYNLSWRKLAALGRKENVERRRHRTRQLFPRMLGIAACLIIVLAIATPFALANIPALRVTVLRMLVSIDTDYTNIGLVEDETASFDIPAEWQGDYFPSYIPDGYEMDKISHRIPYVQFRDSDNCIVSFEECKVSDKINIDTKGAAITYEIINGIQSFVVEQEDSISVAWSNGRKLFLVYAECSKEEMLKVVQSVRYIR